MTSENDTTKNKTKKELHRLQLRAKYTMEKRGIYEKKIHHV